MGFNFDPDFTPDYLASGQFRLLVSVLVVVVVVVDVGDGGGGGGVVVNGGSDDDDGGGGGGGDDDGVIWKILHLRFLKLLKCKAKNFELAFAEL